MNPLRIFSGVGLIIGCLWLVSYLSTTYLVPDYGDATEMDRARPRAPVEAKQIKNPIDRSDAAIERGRALYKDAGNCSICHGLEGRGDGEAGVMLNPKPRDLTDTVFQTHRTDGELFWSIKHGVPQTGMFSYVPRMITEDEAWAIVHYIRTLE